MQNQCIRLFISLCHWKLAGIGAANPFGHRATGMDVKNMELTAGREAGVEDNDFRTLFVTHPTPMWVYDPETLGFLTVNDAARRLYGYSREAYAKMTVLDIRPERERERMRAAVKS